jgi:TonB family protein
MKRSTVFFFFALVVIVAVIARCNSRSRLAEERTEAATPTSPLVPSAAPSASVTPTSSPTATPQPSKSPAVDLGKAAAQIQPAVVSLSVFEPSGKLLRTGSGVFISSSGRILTTRSLMEGSAHAIARTADDKIHNVEGILADSESEDLAVLQMESKDSVPFVAPNPGANVDEAARVAVVGAPLGREKTGTVESSISKKHRGHTSDWLELSTPVSNQEMGAPVVNGRGDLVGVVTHGPGNPAVVVRGSAAINGLVNEIPDSPKSKWLAEETPPSPAEGPLQKIPLAQSPQAQKTKLIYSPAPAYPSSARTASGNLRGTGRFRLTFNANGQVKNIVILRSTQNGALDQAAIEALRRWRAAPGQEWTLNVPITFQ